MLNRPFPFLVPVLCALAAVPARAAAPASDPFQVRMAAERTAALNAAFLKFNVPAQERTALAAAFAKLPLEAQDVVLARIDGTFAGKVHLLPSSVQFAPVPEPLKIVAPTISHLYPPQGEAKRWSSLSGTNLKGEACQVVFDGKPLPSVTVWGMKLFQVPEDAKLGVEHVVTVRDNDTKLVSAPAKYKVVAPRGYRGLHGWKFANFSTPQLTWTLFRDYFGPAAVEYSGGVHRPSAQNWYDATYKGVGLGGDCFGMSVRSVRTRMHSWVGPWKSWWPAHVQPTVWDYASGAEVLDSVRQDQGGQLSLQAMAVINDRWNNQDHNQALMFILMSLTSAVMTPASQPIIGIWEGNKKGHAVVPYKIEADGSLFKISLYDNNKPYKESETNDGNSIGLVYSNTFKYGTWNRMVAYTYSEVAPLIPFLPADAGFAQGSLGADTSVLVCDAKSGIRQITDENGRTFYAGGVENTNKGSRIPDSMRFIPMGGEELPPDYPAIFVFNKSKGRTLTLDLEQGKPGAVRLFNAGRVTTLVGQSGKVHFSKLLTPEQGLKVVDPGAMKLQEVHLIAIDPDRSENSFRLEGFSGIQKGLEVMLDPKGVVLAHGMSGGASLGVQVKRFSKAGVDEGALHKLTIPAGQRGVVKPDFANLKLAPTLELRRM